MTEEDKGLEDIRNRDSLDKAFKKIIKEERKLGKEDIEEMKRDLRDLRNKFEKLDEKIEESKIIEFMERQEISANDKERENDLEEVSIYSRRSFLSYKTDRSDNRFSRESGLSRIEVEKLIRLVTDKDKEERKNNIIIKKI